MKKGSKMPPEAIQKIKDSKKDISIETRIKMSKAQKGKIPWNKNLTKDDPRVANNTRGGWKQTEEMKRKQSEDRIKMFAEKKLSVWNEGLTKDTSEIIRQQAQAAKGKIKTIEHRKAISEGKKGSTPYNKGLTKRTSEIVRDYSEKCSKTVFEQFQNGRKVWCDGLTQAEDPRITGNKYAEGQTKETCEKLKIAGEKQSITKQELFNNGELTVWNDGLTKETDPRMQKASESRIQYMINNQNKKRTYISKREDIFAEWFTSLRLINGTDFIRQYFVKDIDERFLADFYFPRLKLIIEFDGEYRHRGKELRDQSRTQQMRDKGYVVLRFLETIRKNYPIEEANAKENIMKILKYLIEDKNGNN